jgi:hypothetical protein
MPFFSERIGVGGRWAVDVTVIIFFFDKKTFNIFRFPCYYELGHAILLKLSK